MQNRIENCVNSVPPENKEEKEYDIVYENKYNTNVHIIKNFELKCHEGTEE